MRICTPNWISWTALRSSASAGAIASSIASLVHEGTHRRSIHQWHATATYWDLLQPYFCADMTPNLQREVAFTRLFEQTRAIIAAMTLFTPHGIAWYVHHGCQSPLNCCELLLDASETLTFVADKRAKQSNNIQKCSWYMSSRISMSQMMTFSVNWGCLMIGALNLAALMPFPKSASFAMASELTRSGNGETLVGGY